MSDRIIIQICSFDIPSKSAGKFINKESVKNVINSKRFKENLAKGRVLSLLSHADRYAIENKDIPYEDQVLISKYLAGYGKRAWIDESRNAFFGEIELANNDNGKLVKDMLKKGFDLSTSMSVSATADNKYYYVEDILSLGDFTTRPDLEAKIVKIDFSEKPMKNGTNLVTFSQKISNKTILCDFDSTDAASIDDIENNGCPIEEGKSLDCCDCKPGTNNTFPAYKNGIYSESTQFPTEMKEVNKCDPALVKPVPNNMVSPKGSTPNIVNLDGCSGIAGTTVSPLMCSVGFDPNMMDQNKTMEFIHDGVPVENQMTLLEIKQFPSRLTSTVESTVTGNFSLKDIIREWKYQPYMVLRSRINEIIQVCRSAKQEWITQNIDRLRAYFDSYMLTWINTLISDPTKEFNIGMGLRLTTYGVKQKDMMALNRSIKRLRQNVESVGFIQKQVQEQLNTSYQNIENQLYQYIDKKIKPNTFLPENEVKADDDKGRTTK